MEGQRGLILCGEGCRRALLLAQFPVPAVIGLACFTENCILFRSVPSDEALGWVEVICALSRRKSRFNRFNAVIRTIFRVLMKEFCNAEHEQVRRITFWEDVGAVALRRW